LFRGKLAVIVSNDTTTLFDHVSHNAGFVLPASSLDHGYRIAEQIPTRAMRIVWACPPGAGRALLGATGPAA